MARVTLRSTTSETDGELPVAVVIDLEAGCRLASIRVGDRSTPTELLAAPPSDAAPDGTNWGSFPMAPWAGRIRHGILATAEGEIRLGRNHRDLGDDGGASIRPILPALAAGTGAPDDEPRAHAIHGTVFGRPWTIDATTESSLTASCPLSAAAAPGALGWPFGGRAVQTVTVRPRAVDVTLTVEADRVAFPAVIGWHPWFPRPERIEFRPQAMYELDHIGLPTGRLVEPGPPPWDDCFLADDPVELHYDRPVAPMVVIRSDCDHWVVYDKPPATICVEPQSGPPDAANLDARAADGAPVLAEVVAPGDPLRRTMTIAW